MHRFFCPNADFQNLQVDLTRFDEIHHLKNVLRLKPTDTVVIFDGKGREATGTIFSIQTHCISIRLQNVSQEQTRHLQLILVCAIPKNAKFEFIIEKCTELGIDEIIPLITERTEVKLNPERAQQKQKRYQTVAINASKQCQRKTIPTIHPVSSLKSVLNLLKTSSVYAFIPCLSGNREKLSDELKKISTKPSGKIIFLIGPEGDFTAQEIQSAISAGCTPVSLGNRVLKVDTAAIFVISATNISLSL